MNIIRHWKSRRAVRKLRNLMRNVPNNERFMDSIHTIDDLLKRTRPSPVRWIRRQITIIRILFVLRHAMWESVWIWHDASIEGIKARYPLEWKRAVEIAPGLED